MSNSLSVSILIPAHNEESVIENTILQLNTELTAASIEYEILVVNNCSKDKTEQIVDSLSRQHNNIRYINTPDLPGYGVAVRCGLKSFANDSVIIVMADASEKPSDVIALYKELENGADCAFGTRFSGGTVIGYPKFKLLMNRLGNFVLSRFAGLKYDDYTNGFKGYKREIIESITPLVSQEFNLTVEMTIKAIKSSTNVTIVPNSWEDRPDGESKFRLFRQCTLYSVTLLYCFLHHHLRGGKWKLIEHPSNIQQK